MDLRWYGYTLVLGGAAVIVGGIVLDAFNFVLAGGGLVVVGGMIVHRGNSRGR